MTEQDHFDLIDRLTQELITGMIEDGARSQDISGALTKNAVALLIATDGRDATCEHLFDLAARIKSGAEIDYRRPS